MGIFDFFRAKKPSPAPRQRLKLSTITESDEWNICQSFGNIAGLAISDAALLPCQKERVAEALETVEKQLCSKGNELVKEQASIEGLESIEGIDSFSDLRSFYAEERQQVDRYLNAIRCLKTTIDDFVGIDPQDRLRVKHFNSFPSVRNIPTSEKSEWIDLSVKYRNRARGPMPPMDKAAYDAIVKEVCSEEGQEKLRQIREEANER